jgi:hypothetical protein
MDRFTQLADKYGWFVILPALAAVPFMLAFAVIKWTFFHPRLAFYIYLPLVTVSLVLANEIVAALAFIAFMGAVYFLVPRYLGPRYLRYNLSRAIQIGFAHFYAPGEADQAKGMTAVRKLGGLKVKATSTRGVFRVLLRTPLANNDEDLMRQLPAVASALGVVKLIPLDEDERAGYISVLFCFVDPLEAHLHGEDAPVLHLTDEEKQDPYLWLPVGIDGSGELYEAPLFLKEGGSVRSLHAGISGAGKSSVVVQQILQATQNPSIDVHICDGKGGSEFALFQPYAQSFAIDKASFFAQLRLLEAEVTRRSRILGENKAKDPNRFSSAWNVYDDGNLLLWVWDELGRIKGQMKMVEQAETDDRIYGIASVARSLGIAIIFSAQTFRSDILSTKTRDNCFDIAFGFQTNGIQESEYIGFSPTNDVRPDLIKGKLLKSGRTSTVGQFATRGLRSDYGKSYYISDVEIIAVLKDLVADEVSLYLQSPSAEDGRMSADI